MARIQELSDALRIVRSARVEVHQVNPAAWGFLVRVSDHLTRQLDEAFVAEFGAQWDIAE